MLCVLEKKTQENLKLKSETERTLFLKLFDHCRVVDSIQEFNVAVSEMLERFPESKEYFITNKLSLKEKWARASQPGTLTLEIQAAQRLESLNEILAGSKRKKD